jgi:hypothetical protein
VSPLVGKSKKPGNLLVAGTGQTAALPVTLQSLTPDLLQVRFL